uniref:Helicase C-terminal domain-containing protein n=1 Tax=Eutreptiella gymnastica TaxID=73025 RepID=A0A7S4CXK7_9EUGL
MEAGYGGRLPWQYVFAGATMPMIADDTRKNVRAGLKERFPYAKWVKTDNLHEWPDQLVHDFRMVKDKPKSRRWAMLDALDNAIIEVRQRTLVFANSIVSVQQAYEALRSAGWKAQMYHKGMPFEDREEVLERFRNGQFPILVCGKEITRGVDLPAITHVIQYEFAGNAYDHMHRVGRTARMGNPGQATTLYTPWERPLVKAIERSRYEGLTHFHHVDRRYRLRLKEEGVSAGLKAKKAKSKRRKNQENRARVKEARQERAHLAQWE